MEQVNSIGREVMTIVTTYGLDVVGAIVILIVGWWLSSRISSVVRKALKRSKYIDETLQGFFSSLVKYAIIVFTIIAVLNQFGVETTSFIAVLGAAGLAIGLALQGTLSNIAAGVMLLIFRPFKVGDFIDGGGVTGTVKSISLFVTEMATPDNVQIIVPNAGLWGTSIKNYSHNAKRRVDFVFGIGYGDDINKAIKEVLAIAGKDERIDADPAPMCVVGNLGDSSVDLICRVWCNAGDYWGIKFDMTQAVKERFDKVGISIPFPQRDVHLIKDAAE
jgi:small conductance mechanosensitive channel